MGQIILNRDQYRDKVTACWLGKNIGGTLGEPFEWRRQINQVTFYTQDLAGEPLPNDDLDIQLLWLIALEEQGIDLDARTLSEYWCLYITPHWSEYGTAKINMRSGLVPPLSGMLSNEYKDSCGAFIRSEIWACIAPGCPSIAARYGYQDAILDHGDGEGTYGEVFCAALESAAFVVSDLRELIDIGLSYIPPDCGIAQAVHCVLTAFDGGASWREARDEILRHHRGSTHLGDPARTSPEDREKGFHEGKRGYDAPSNIAITVLGLLYGGDDLSQVLCTTVNCGEDTDCTAATAGSIYGIIHGTAAIPKRWIEPIGRSIVTACLNLGELGHYGSRLPQTVDELTDRTERMAAQVLLRQPECDVMLEADGQTDLAGLDTEALRSDDGGASLYTCVRGPIFRFDFFTVSVDYGDGPDVRRDEPVTIRLTIRNLYRVQARLSLHWYLPDGWHIDPAPDGGVMSLPPHLGPPVTVEFTLLADRVERAMNRCVVEFAIDARPTVMLVPITLLNGSVAPASGDVDR